MPALPDRPSRTLRVLALAAMLLAAGPAWATQEYILPTLFDVTGVGERDVLNIRAAPSPGAEIIGALAHDARGVEVVAHDRTGRWGRVNTRERAGWVALRYLRYRTDVWEEGRVPAHLHCLGTEPFWAFRTEDDALILATPEEPDRELALASVLGTGVFRDPHRALIARGEELRLTVAITPTACSDGMSDRAYGLGASLIREGEGGPELLTGCCSIAPPRD